MKDEQIHIKISGIGTKGQIYNALISIANEILSTPVENLDGCEWEDHTLLTEMNIVKP